DQRGVGDGARRGAIELDDEVVVGECVQRAGRVAVFQPFELELSDGQLPRAGRHVGPPWKGWAGRIIPRNEPGRKSQLPIFAEPRAALTWLISAKSHLWTLDRSPLLRRQSRNPVWCQTRSIGLGTGARTMIASLPRPC